MARPVIVRTSDHQFLLIAQPVHAALAATLMNAWRADGLPTSPRRDAILRATLTHDDGWIEEDRAPIVDEPSGRILDFMTAPAPVRQGVWPRGVSRLSSTPYEAALVAQHAISVYRSNQSSADWARFFAVMETLRDEHLARCAPRTLEDLVHDYFFVRIGDFMSLIFCNAWTDVEHLAHYELRLQGTRLSVTPDPFGGRHIPFTVEARRLPGRRFDREGALAAYASAPLVTLTGVATGP